MENLYFYIQGSLEKPYQVTFEGTGQNLKAFCTCPAGRKGGYFCKHVAMLLNCDTSKLIEGHDAIDNLHKRAEGSPLLKKAREHVCTPTRKPHKDLTNIHSINDLAAHVSKRISETSFWSEHGNDEDEAEFISIFMRKYYKNGKPYKNPTLLIRFLFDPYQKDYMWDEAIGVYIEVERKKKVKPFLVGNSSFGKFESAATKFLTKLDEILATSNNEEA